MSDELTRRQAIALGAAATVAVSLEKTEALAAQSAPATFFTRPELALADELAEMIIPADEHSPVTIPVAFRPRMAMSESSEMAVYAPPPGELK